MKYEYKVIYDGHTESVAPATHSRILNAYGAEGWELVSVCSGVPNLRDFSDKPSTFVYYFKRPLLAPNE